MFERSVYAIPAKKAYTTLKALQKKFPAVLIICREKK
jgi:hypothetical protein